MGWEAVETKRMKRLQGMKRKRRGIYQQQKEGQERIPKCLYGRGKTPGGGGGRMREEEGSRR